MEKNLSRYNFNKNKPALIQLMRDSFKKIDAGFWGRCIRKTIKIEGNYWISDGITEDLVNNNCDNLLLNQLNN